MIFKQPQYTTSQDGEESYGSRKRILSEMNNLLDNQEIFPNDFVNSTNNNNNFDSINNFDNNIYYNNINNMSNQHLFNSDDDDEEEEEEQNIIDQYNLPTTGTDNSKQNMENSALPTLKELFQNPERPDPINLWQFYKFLATSPNGKLINLLDFYLDYKSHTQFMKNNNKSIETVQTVTFLSSNIHVRDLYLNSDAIHETYFQNGCSKFIMELSLPEMEQRLPIICDSVYHLLESELYPIFLKSITYHNIHSTKISLKFCLIGTCIVWLGFWLYYCFVFLNMNRAYRLISLLLILVGVYMVLNIGLFKIDFLLYSLDLIQLNDDDSDSDNIGRIGKEKSFKVGDELTFNSFGKRGEFLRKFSLLVYGGNFINYKKEYGIHYILKKRIVYSSILYACISCALIALLLGVPGRRL